MPVAHRRGIEGTRAKERWGSQAEEGQKDRSTDAR